MSFFFFYFALKGDVLGLNKSILHNSDFVCDRYGKFRKKLKEGLKGKSILALF